MKPMTLLLATVLLLLLTSAVAAQDGTRITRWTVDGGGASSQAAGYDLTGAIGQPDVGTLAGGGYTLAGGFWGSEMARIEVYLPLGLK